MFYNTLIKNVSSQFFISIFCVSQLKSCFCYPTTNKKKTLMDRLTFMKTQVVTTKF